MHPDPEARHRWPTAQESGESIDSLIKATQMANLHCHFPVFLMPLYPFSLSHPQMSRVPFFRPCFIFNIKHPHRCLSPNAYLPHLPPSSLSVCQTLVKEAVVHPLEVEPGQFLPQTEQSLAPLPAPQPSSHPGRARISLAISVGPAPVLPSTVTRSALTPRPPTLEDGMRGLEGWRERSGGRERWGLTKERMRGRLSQQKERKATQMLAIVLGERREVQTN